jgi:hypothetical protein
MPTIFATLGCVLQLVIVALVLSEWCRRRRAETLAALWVLRVGSEWVVLVVVSQRR